MDEVVAYFALKIEMKVSAIEAWTRKDGQRFLAEVERQAKQLKDSVLADFFRRTAMPDRILSRLSAVRELLREGKIVEADKALDRLLTDGLAVDQFLQRPILKFGIKSRSRGQRVALQKHGTPEQREQKADEIRKAFQQRRKAGDSIGDAQRAVARQFRISSRTVRKNVRGK